MSDVLVTLLVYGLFGLITFAGLVWALISRVKREKKEEEYEDRIN